MQRGGEDLADDPQPPIPPKPTVVVGVVEWGLQMVLGAGLRRGGWAAARPGSVHRQLHQSSSSVNLGHERGWPGGGVPIRDPCRARGHRVSLVLTVVGQLGIAILWGGLRQGDRGRCGAGNLQQPLSVGQ